jgi:hypothetical protein
MDTTTAKNAHNAADRRLVEYFLIISTIEKNQKKKNKANHKTQSNNNGDMTFSDWRTETSGMISTDDTYRNNSNGNGNSNIHDFYNNNISLQPKITARYPLIDHYDHPLQDENVIFFCHPSGSISVRTQPHMPKVRVTFLLEGRNETHL